MEVEGNEVLSIPRQQLTVSGSGEVTSDSVRDGLIAGEKYHVEVVLLTTQTVLSTSSVASNRRTVFNQHVRLCKYFTNNIP